MPMKMSSTLLEHHPVVGREVRLALDAVDDQRVDGLALGDLELDVGRERRAAEADDAGILDRRDDLVGRRRSSGQGVPSSTSCVEPGNGSR